VIQRFALKYHLNLNRTVASRAKMRDVSETEAAVTGFFRGTTLTRDSPTGPLKFELPGYEAVVNLPWTTDADGKPLLYKDSPHRVGSFDESALGGIATPKGVAPKGARHVAVVAAPPGKSITVFSGATFAGHWFPDHFIMEGIVCKQNPLLFAPPGSKVMARPDGYMQTQDTWLHLLNAMAEEIPGEKRRRRRGFGSCANSPFQAGSRPTNASSAYWTGTPAALAPTAYRRRRTWALTCSSCRAA